MSRFILVLFLSLFTMRAGAEGALLEIEADQVIHEGSNLIRAIGNVIVDDKQGSIIYAQSISYYPNEKQIIAYNSTIQLAKGEVIKAKEIKITERKFIEATQLKYTRCDIHNNSFTSPAPLWALEGRNLVYNQDKERVVIKNSLLRFMGLPVFYIPYFSFPSPKAKKASGFLSPLVRWNKEFGTNVRIPYYQVLGSNMELTITPWIQQRGGQQIALQFGHLTHTGRYTVNMSAAQTKVPNTATNSGYKDLERYHIDAKGDFTSTFLSPYSRVGFEIFRVKDKLNTYLKKYDIDNRDILPSRLYYDNYHFNHFLVVDALQFQGLRTFDDFKITPQAYPRVNYYHDYSFEHDIYTSINFDFLHLYRSEGRNLRRGVMEVKGNKYAIYGNHNLEYFTSLRGEYYDSEVVNPYGEAITRYRNLRNLPLDMREIREGRIFPLAGASWYYHARIRLAQQSLLLKPKATLILSPTIGQERQYINEDSQSPELSIENLHLKNIYKGRDRIQDGSRVIYSLTSYWRGQKSGVLLELGQQYSFNNNNNFDQKSGLGYNFSDYVLGFKYDYGNFFEWHNKLRLDQKKFDIEQVESGVYLAFKQVVLKLDYYGLGKKATVDTDINYRNELLARLDWRFYPGLNLSYSNRSRLGAHRFSEKKLIAQELALLYKGKCLESKISVSREYTTLNDLRPLTNYNIRFNVPIN